jgi:hypothetical protein
MLDADRQRRRQEARKARDRRYRLRRDACRACYVIEADGELLDLLVRLGWIGEAELLDKKAVERALSEMLAASSRS